MVSWQSYFDATVCINLEKRKDRKCVMVSQFDEYEIHADFCNAYENEKGYFGLVVTMKKLFESCLQNGFEKILVFEDDAKFIHTPEEFHYNISHSIEGLQYLNWDLFYLGLQHTKRFRKWETKWILPVEAGYSTHAVAYSKRAMQFVVEKPIDEPIDNFLVREFQPYNTSYCTYPQLVTQFTGYSDIGQEHCNWNHYIISSYEKHIREIMQQRNYAKDY